MVHHYKFRVLPTLVQEALIEDTFAVCTYLYNYFLNLQLERIRKSDPAGLCELVTRFRGMKAGQEWMHRFDPAALHWAVQESFRDVGRYRLMLSQNPDIREPAPRSHDDPRHHFRLSTSGGGVSVGDGVVKLPYLGEMASTVSRTAPLEVAEAVLVQGMDTCYELAIRCITENGRMYPILSVGYFGANEFMDELIRRRCLEIQAALEGGDGFWN